MRCGGWLGDFAGEVRVRELTARESSGEPGAAIVTWRGGGTICGDLLGDLAGKVRDLKWLVFVDGQLETVTDDTSAEVDVTPGDHVLIEVIGVAANLAALPSENIAETSPAGSRVRLVWTHAGGGQVALFRIYWDEGSGEVPDVLYAEAPFESDSENYSYTTAPLADGNYRFGVAAVDSAGNETAIQEAGVQVLGLPDPPVELSYSYEASGRQLSLSWS